MLLNIFWHKVVKVCPQTKNYRSMFTGSSLKFDSKNQGVATASSQVSGEELLLLEQFQYHISILGLITCKRDTLKGGICCWLKKELVT